MTLAPRRIVCLSAESADWLARIGAWERVVGVTAYFDPPVDLPPRPRIAGFSTARLDAILALNPDLVVGYSDVQAPIAVELIRRGLAVLVTNQRTLAETYETLELLARVVDRAEAAEPWLRRWSEQLAAAPVPARRPRVYFEEWPEPPVAGIGWVSELIERAGGEDVFAALRGKGAAAERTVSLDSIVAAAPEVLCASWCGRPVDWSLVRARPGWSTLPCVQSNRLYEIPSDDILQPGYRLVEGYRRLRELLDDRRASV